MKQTPSIGKQIKVARQHRKMSQLELARKCGLNVRSIQRIENDEVNPRFYTLRILEEVLDISLTEHTIDKKEQQQLLEFRKEFLKRKQIRTALFIVALFVLISALFLIFSGIPKLTWAPYIYILMFAILIGIGLSWRCPGCNAILGDLFNTRYCSKCGLDFYDEKHST